MEDLANLIAEAEKTSFRDKGKVKEFITSLLAHGFSRADIASACGVTRLTICAWEAGEMSPNNKNAKTLADLHIGLFGEHRVAKL